MMTAWLGCWKRCVERQVLVDDVSRTVGFYGSLGAPLCAGRLTLYFVWTFNRTKWRGVRRCVGAVCVVVWRGMAWNRVLVLTERAATQYIVVPFVLFLFLGGPTQFNPI